ncbi:MAG TPA: aspartate aminotransferase family protein [Candidatus Thiothrix moscowensis]|uniref:aspartate aminotransferase family protein n=3 Tax=Thiothrix TaxID=1030 RepID=UPI0025F8BC0E|nr:MULTISPECIES: aspartate aminotransferase family protein [unclassified Thiothrix]HRJ51383.1 aspartate aminotransferase family protein [Candidatus Thiothrix moscowensis]HRJ91562.1 aspartate aminotransferase family protein [Candidatus Thiothrix moscowensis]
MTHAVMPTYARLPVTFTKGEDALLWDTTGKQYLDALSGISVCNVGHARREVADAICAQAHELLHTSNLYQIAHQEALAEKLCALSGLDKVFFSNSGAEANEAALKIARLYGHNKGIAVPTVVVMTNSFHGRTMATLTATGNTKVQTGFAPLVEGFVRVEYGDAAAVEALAATNPNIVAVLVEPVQGEGGIRIPADDYLPRLRAICDQHDWLLMLDEIQSGMCRTGKWFAFQHTAIQPDVMTLAKALGNGVPIGACLAGGKAASVFGPGNHGSTFGGNPLACRAALAVIEVMEQANLAARAAELGDYFLSQFRTKLAGVAGVREIRVKGLMLGIELERDCGELVKQALEKGILINVTAGNVIRLLPPLVISYEQAEQIITMVTELVQAFLSPAAGEKPS